MKKILLLTFLIVGYILPALSQLDSRPLKNQLQIDTTFKRLNYNLMTPSLHVIHDLDWLFNDPKYDRKYFCSNQSVKKQKIGQEFFVIIKTAKPFDNMPCVKPQGFSNMPIFVPDSTVRHTILTKRP